MMFVKPIRGSKNVNPRTTEKELEEQSFSDLLGHGRVQLPQKATVSMTSVYLFFGEHPKSQVNNY